MTTLAMAQAQQSLTPGDLVLLYTLDLTPIGVPETYRFTPTKYPDADVYFAGQLYAYAPIDLTGVDWSSEGQQGSPTLFLPNGSKFAAALVTQHQDLLGARVTRVRTYRQFLDGQAMADPNATLSRDVFIVQQKKNMNRIYAEFALAPMHVMDGRKIPGRVCLKGLCTHRYRVWNGTAFDYAKATCPYTGAAKFKPDGTSTANNAEDQCGKRLADCIARFGDAPLPTRAFPGMNRIRV